MTASLPASIDRYLGYLRVERRYSASTLDNYARALAKLHAYAERLDLHQWNELRSAQLQALVAEQHRAGLAPASLGLFLSSCRSFFRYLARDGEVKVAQGSRCRRDDRPA